MGRILNSLYTRLFRYYGARNWWPADTPFEMMVGAILTQNTAWVNVEKSIAEIRRRNLLDPARLHNLPEEQIGDVVRSSGYYRLKARRIVNLLDFFRTVDYDIETMKKISDVRDCLLAVNGIGPETADSILLYALDIPQFVIDAYTMRIFYRTGITQSQDESYESVQALCHRTLPRDARLFNEYHALIVTHAKTHCRKTPVCAGCPVASICAHRLQTDTSVAKTRGRKSAAIPGAHI